jgi:hypothetical protein
MALTFEAIRSCPDNGSSILHGRRTAALPGAEWQDCRAAQLGLLPQVHRDEEQIYANVRCLLAASGRRVLPLDNVPNRYLRPKSRA